MDRSYWQRQTADKPLFPNLLWSRPENRQHAGKLLIIGGNTYGFAAPGETYNQAVKAGIGTARVLLPDTLRRTVGMILEAGEYAATNPSGSFSKKALADWTDQAMWADGVLLAGDLGRNSETAIVLETFMQKYSGQLTLTKDAIAYILSSPVSALERPDTLLVLTMADLQRLFTVTGQQNAITLHMDVLRLVDVLQEFTSAHPLKLITKHADLLIAADGGQISTTHTDASLKAWHLKTAAYASVWWLQNPSNAFQALTTAIADSQEASET